MATRSIKPKRDDSLLAGWETVPEKAPSETVVDQPTLARIIGFLALLLAAIGAMALFAPVVNWRYLISPSWGFFFISLGAAGMLYHAFRDADDQFRIIYFGFAFVLLAAGIVLRVIPIKDVVGGWFMPVGVPCLGAAYLFLLAVLRNETDAFRRKLICYTLGTVGIGMSLAGFVVGNFNQNFLMGEGVILITLGLLYISGFIGGLGVNSTLGYRAGLVVGAIGALGFSAALLRSITVSIQFAPRFAMHGNFSEFLVPSGLILGMLGLLYLAVAIALCSDAIFVVLVRRELLAFFYSPVAYLVLVGCVIIGGVQFMWFLASVIDQGGTIEEPITRNLSYPNFFGLIAITFLVPVITMRLLSEERRSGTLEVLLTAPLNESSIVLSKFVAAWIFLMLSVAPWWINLLAMRVLGGVPFDYRSMLSFMVAFAVSGAGFLSIGLFFSAVTKNQIIAAVLTFAAMLGLTSLLLLTGADRPFREVFSYISYLDLWLAAQDGLFTPRLLLFHISAAVFFLFVTVKVLESRKWS